MEHLTCLLASKNWDWSMGGLTKEVKDFPNLNLFGIGKTTAISLYQNLF